MPKQIHYLITTLLVLLALGAGFGLKDCQAQAELAAAQAVTDNLIQELGVVQEDLTVVRNEKVDAATALERALVDNAQLVDQLATMGTKVQDLQAIIRSTGTLTAPEPEVVTVHVTEPARPHVFATEEGLVVAELQSSQQGDQVAYTYTTHQLDFETSLVVTEQKASVDVHVVSSAEPENRIRIIQQTRSLVVPPEPLQILKPQISLGATAILGEKPELMGSLTFHWLHPHKSVDLLSPRVSGSAQTFIIGIDAIHYNIADPIPIIDNLWIGAGINISHRGEFSAAITLGAKL